MLAVLPERIAREMSRRLDRIENGVAGIVRRAKFPIYDAYADPCCPPQEVTGNFYQFGGRDRAQVLGSAPEQVDDCDAYDRVGDAWAAMANLPTGRWDYHADSIGAESYLVFGRLWSTGTFTKRNDGYSWSTDSFTSLADGPDPARGQGAAVATGDGKLRYSGGIDTTSFGNRTLDCDAYDPGSDSWSAFAVETYPGHQANARSAMAIDGDMAVSPCLTTGPGYTTRRYDVSGDSWSDGAVKSNGSSSQYGAAAGGNNGSTGAVVFGSGATSAGSNAVSLYTYSTDSWGAGTTGTARSYFGGNTDADGYTFASCGMNATGPVGEFVFRKMQHCATLGGSWTTGTDIPLPARDYCMGTCPNQ